MLPRGPLDRDLIFSEIAPTIFMANIESSAKGESTLTQKTTSGVAWSSALQVSRQVLSVLSVSILTKKIPPSAYGLMAMVGILGGFIETFRDLGTTSAMVREPVLSDRFISTMFWLNASIGLAITTLAYVAAQPFAEFFHAPVLARLIQVSVAYFFIVAMGVVPGALLTRKMSFQKIAIAQFAGAVVGTATSITMAILGEGVWSLVFGSLVSNSICVLVYWLYHPVRIHWIVDRQCIRSISKYSLNLTGFGVVNYFTRNADNIIVGRYLGSGPLGLYQMGYTFLTLPLSSFSAMIVQVLFPAMATVQDDESRLRSAFMRTSTLIALFTFPVMMGLLVTADPFVRVFLSPKWVPVIGLLTVFAPLGAAQSVVTVSGILYTVKGRTEWMFRWGLFSGILFVLSFVFGVRWGIQGVAVSYTIMWCILAPIGLTIAFRLIHLPMREYLRQFWPILKPSLVMTAVAAGWLHGLRWLGVGNSVVLLLTTSVVGAACYVGLIFWWRPPAIAELRKVMEHSGNSLAIRAAGYLPS